MEGNKTSRINTWKPKKKEIFLEKDGKLMICHFDKIFTPANRVEPYKRFNIGKESYINQLDKITQYINFFINNYDKENELLMAYLKVKFALDKKHLFHADNMQAYIDFLYAVLFTNTMIDKIIAMVEENYLDDIESTSDDRKKYLKNEKKHLESLEFTNQHIKILLAISFGMKIMSPVLLHYTQMNGIKLSKDNDIIYQFYKRLFDLFGYSNVFEIIDPFGRVVESGISEEDANMRIEEQGLTPVDLGNREIRYYWEEDGTDGRFYLHRSTVDMYNKLYVYVSFCVQILVTVFSKTLLIAGNS